MTYLWKSMALGCLIGLAAPAMADVKAGVDAWQQGDYAKAIAEWRPLALAGDPDAQGTVTSGTATAICAPRIIWAC